MSGDRYQSLEAEDKPDLNTQLYRAIKNNDYEETEHLLEQGADPNYFYDLSADPDYSGVTPVVPPLVLAYLFPGSNAQKIMKLLLNKGADPSFASIWGNAQENNLRSFADLFDENQHFFGQRWLPIFIQALSEEKNSFYDIQDDGVCHGLTHMAAQMVHFRKVDEFNKQINAMYTLYLEARKQALATLGFKPKDLRSSPENKSRYEKTLAQTIKKQLNMRDDKINIHAFCDGIIIAHDQIEHQLAHLYPADKKKAQKLGRFKRAQDLLSPDGDPARKLSCCANFSGAYSLDELETFFRLLLNKMNESKLEGPVSFILSNQGHTMYFGYDPDEQQLFFMNANTLPMQRVAVDSKNPCKQMALKTARALYECHSWTSVFGTSIYTSQADSQKMHACFKKLESDPEWVNLHRVTPEKLNLRDQDGDSRWLWIARYEADYQTLAVIPLSTNFTTGDWFLSIFTLGVYPLVLYLNNKSLIKAAAADAKIHLTAPAEEPGKPLSPDEDKACTVMPKEKLPEKGIPAVLPYKDPLHTHGITTGREWKQAAPGRKSASDLRREKLVSRKSFKSNTG